MSTRYDPVTEPQVGDLAAHRCGTLPDREVVRIQGNEIWIKIGEVTCGPLLAVHYTYLRPVKVLENVRLIEVGWDAYGFGGHIKVLPADPDRSCRVCHCTDGNACLPPAGPCWWVEADLCSACRPEVTG